VNPGGCRLLSRLSAEPLRIGNPASVERPALPHSTPAQGSMAMGEATKAGDHIPVPAGEVRRSWIQEPLK
jgi:hypothetical protein